MPSYYILAFCTSLFLTMLVSLFRLFYSGGNPYHSLVCSVFVLLKTRCRKVGSLEERWTREMLQVKLGFQIYGVMAWKKRGTQNKSYTVDRSIWSYVSYVFFECDTQECTYVRTLCILYMDYIYIYHRIILHMHTEINQILIGDLLGVST